MKVGWRNNILIEILKYLLQNRWVYVIIGALQKNHAYRFFAGAVHSTGGEGVNRIDACAAEKI